MTKTHIDVAALYSAVDAARKELEVSWRELSRRIGVSPSLFSRLGNGRRPDADGFATLIRWLGMPAEQFIVDDEGSPQQPELTVSMAPLLRAQKDLSDADVRYLEDIIQATVRRARTERGRER